MDDFGLPTRRWLVRGVFTCRMPRFWRLLDGMRWLVLIDLRNFSARNLGFWHEVQRLVHCCRSHGWSP